MTESENAQPIEPLHDTSVRGFASDNYSGIHPEVLEAIARANGGHQVAYGEDDYTARLQEVVKGHFGERATAYPVFNGTGGNVVALQAVTRRFEGVLTTSTAHIHIDECAAPERIGGLKLTTIDTPDGKLTPELLDTVGLRRGDEHHSPERVVSITQSTELGTAYSVEEIAAVADWAHAHDMVLHVDGSRLSNAAASTGASLGQLTTEAGADILTLGGTKNGIMLGEAVVVLNPDCAPDVVSGMPWLRKQSMQLASKMRFISAQLVALYEGDLYLRNAAHSNAMAQRLVAAVRDVPGLTIAREVQANAVFAVLPQEISRELMKSFRFYFWDEATGEVRWMCSFDTTEADVDTFARAVREAMA